MKAKEIRSPNNPAYRRFLDLVRTRGIKKHGLALMGGKKHVTEVLSEFPHQCEAMILLGSGEESEGLLAPPQGLSMYALSPELFRELDLHNTGPPLLVLRVDPFPWWSDLPWSSGCTLCIPFQDPTNVGAVIRSAAAFGVSRVVMLKEAAHPFHPKSIRAAGSSILRIPLVQGPSLYEFSPSGVPLVVLSPEGVNVSTFAFPQSFCLLAGLEGAGLPEDLRRGTTLAIPMENRVESLNAALATGIALYRWRQGLTA